MENTVKIIIRITVALIIVISAYNYYRSYVIGNILRKIKIFKAFTLESAMTPNEMGIISPFELFQLRSNSILGNKIKKTGDSSTDKLINKQIYIDEDCVSRTFVRFRGSLNKGIKGIATLVIGSVLLIIISELIIKYWEVISSLINGLIASF